ncbi:MAG: HAMP domain-containing sensor histidine kinase [Acidobacteriaceae bacterium]
MQITRRRGTIAFFITLGACLVALAIALNVGWVILNWREIVPLVLGIFFFGILIAGVVLNTIFLVREIRRNERHDSFLNAVTHELKTPIASIRLYLETLQRRNLSEEKRQEFYGIMIDDSERLLATVEQVLKAGEVGQRGADDINVRVDIETMLKECIATVALRNHLPPEALVLSVETGKLSTVVLGNPEDLRTAMMNVLDNAVKYSPKDPQIRIHLGVEHDAWVVIRVTDNGIGISSVHLKRIFKRFYRAPSMAILRTKGTGLGLFLVRTIARQHGGDAVASSEGEGRGATITLQLPRMLHQ